MTEKLKNFIKKHGYDNAVYLGEWNGWSCYEPYCEDSSEPLITGLPTTIMVMDDQFQIVSSELSLTIRRELRIE